MYSNKKLNFCLDQPFEISIKCLVDRNFDIKIITDGASLDLDDFAGKYICDIWDTLADVQGFLEEYMLERKRKYYEEKSGKK